MSSRSISADVPISYCFHVKVGSAIGRQVSPVIPEVSRRCDVTPEVETVTYRVYRVLSQQVCVRQTLGARMSETMTEVEAATGCPEAEGCSEMCQHVRV